MGKISLFKKKVVVEILEGLRIGTTIYYSLGNLNSYLESGNASLYCKIDFVVNLSEMNFSHMSTPFCGSRMLKIICEQFFSVLWRFAISECSLSLKECYSVGVGCAT